MTSSQRSRFAAGVVFLLIAVVVMGGMAWATQSTFELARRTVVDERERRISRAVWEMSNYMAGIINAETARTWDEYAALQIRETVAVFSPEGADRDAHWAVLRSPLAVASPPHKWIDLYFYINPKGVISSPQISDEAALWLLDNPQLVTVPPNVPDKVWEWVKSALTALDLHENAAFTDAGRQPASPFPADGDAPAATTADDRSASDEARRDLRTSREYLARRKSLREAQANYLPPPDCVEPERNIHTASDMPQTGFDGDDVQEYTTGPFAALWLGTAPDGRRRLAFVREGHAADVEFYQGFIGDWDQLKPVLLSLIDNLLPTADLEPVSPGDDVPPEAADTRMINLPVRLHLPDSPYDVASAAWGEVRGTVIAGWTAAAVVLAVAGVGVRNLVALTERRMQFAYAVTHELRTPLTTFRLYSDMLSAGLVPQDAKQEYVDTLNRESIRLSSLVEEVLEFARLENQRVRLNAVETDAPSLLRAISETFVKRCEVNGVEPRIDNAVPDGQQLRTDVDIVNRIAGVLVNNACRHATGTVGAAVLIRLFTENGTLCMDVIDTGPGIDRADLRAIFRPFRRGREADKAARGGLGLGLALARGWAALLNGRLELAARHHPQYGGAHFRLSIPDRLPG